MQGSDVIGGDDVISRAHPWGPQFWLWLPAEDHAAEGKALSERINVAAPREWNGYRLTGGGDMNVMVESLPGRFASIARIKNIPPAPDDWTGASESALFFIRHGAIWHDGPGEMARWRPAMREYPPRVLRDRLAEECFRVWHHGEYNFVQRMAKRRDPLAIAVCLGEFVHGVMTIRLLMDRYQELKARSDE